MLTAIIELYIATGEPVASQAVARVFADRDGLSSATIRNVMATLGDGGTAGAAAYLSGTGADSGGVSLLRGADYEAGRPQRAGCVAGIATREPQAHST